MDVLAFEHHLTSPAGSGLLDDSEHRGSAGGAACGDLIDFRVELTGSRVTAGFAADGCGALTASGSAVVSLVDGKDLLEAALVSTEDVSRELGGLSAAKLHAAELATDAFHRALGSAAREVNLPEVKGRRLVAMSGGVDSAVAAVLNQGAGPVVADAPLVLGVTLELWRDTQTDAAASCCSHVAVRRAREMAHSRGIPHLTLDLREEFREGVVDPWLAGYKEGRTPNPCVQCNGRVRIEPMVDLAMSLGAEKLVTGHYARLVMEPGHEGKPLLREGSDPNKEQAYALARVPAAVLSRMEFPLGEMTKPAVRKLAGDAGLPVADQPDSQDLCFLAGVGREAFLKRHGGLDDVEGPILDEEGQRVGTHRGIHHHTVGQRRGLGIGGGQPLYVLRTDRETNTVTVASKDRIASVEVLLEDIDLRRDSSRVTSARLRHHATAVPAKVELSENGYGVLTFTSPVETVAPGQVACLLDGDLIIGCATISSHAA
ncbi:MAG: tRNA 2-thiouridine(34) synthase MnmA [Actinomycetes bacterium]